MKDELKKELREKTAGYIIGGFGLVAGLAWNEAITSLINSLFPVSRNGILAKFIYAALMTLILVIAARYIVKLFNGEESK